MNFFKYFLNSNLDGYLWLLNVFSYHTLNSSYTYTNKINNFRKNHILNNARLEDIEKRNASNKVNFIIYSVFACIFIIVFLVFLRKLNR
jgi:hypothetical protein